MPKNLIEQVLKTVRNYDMLKTGDSVLAAVSGGPDSVFLLHVLIRLRSKLKLKEIAVCNLDHGLRGNESEEDSDFVRRACKDLGLRCAHKRIDLKKIRSKDLSIEEAAREERYKFFKETAKRFGANVLATGHTLDDQAETILMRLIKGASFKGIVGISPVREEGALRIIRPLLELEKGEIILCLGEKGIDYRIDQTNLEPVYFRNVVRKEIIPFLERYNPRLKRSLFNLAEHLREDFEFIQEAKRAAKRKPQNAKRKTPNPELALKDIAIQPAALQKEILRDALEAAGGAVKRLSFRHWKELAQLIKHKRKGNSVDLPGGIRVTRTDNALRFYRL